MMTVIRTNETRQRRREYWAFSRGSEQMVGPPKMGLASCRWDASHSTVVRVRAGGTPDFRRGRRGRAGMSMSDWFTCCIEKEQCEVTCK